MIGRRGYELGTRRASRGRSCDAPPLSPRGLPRHPLLCALLQVGRFAGWTQHTINENDTEPSPADTHFPSVFCSKQAGGLALHPLLDRFGMFLHQDSDTRRILARCSSPRPLTRHQPTPASISIRAGGRVQSTAYRNLPGRTRLAGDARITLWDENQPKDPARAHAGTKAVGEKPSHGQRDRRTAASPRKGLRYGPARESFVSSQGAGPAGQQSKATRNRWQGRGHPSQPATIKQCGRARADSSRVSRSQRRPRQSSPLRVSVASR